MPPSPKPVAMAALLIVAILTFSAIMDETAELQGQSVDEQHVDVVPAADFGQFVFLDHGHGTNETVRRSAGWAVNTSGQNDSYVQTRDGINISAGANWTISVWGWVDAASQNAEMTLLSVDGSVLVTYNGSAPRWEVWYYDRGSRRSFATNVTAPDQPSAWVNLQVSANGTHLTLTRNGSANSSVNITRANTTDAPVGAGAWDGRIEELRTFNQTLPDAVAQDLVDHPLDPRPFRDRTARVMFDERGSATQSVFFTDTRLQQFNVHFSPGFQARALTRGQNYEWRENGPQINVNGSGTLANVPAVYATYRQESTLRRWVGGNGRLLRVAALLPFLMVLGAMHRWWT